MEAIKFLKYILSRIGIMIVLTLCRHCADTGSGYGLSVKHICFQKLYDK